jgi:hypothetical protein
MLVDLVRVVENGECLCTDDAHANAWLVFLNGFLESWELIAFSEFFWLEIFRSSLIKACLV